MTKQTPTCPVDLQDGLARAGDDRDFYRELLDLFLEDTPPRVAELRDAIAQADAARISSLAHAMKGAAANLSAIDFKNVAYTIEQKGRKGQLAGLMEDFALLAAELQRVVDFAREF